MCTHVKYIDSDNWNESPKEGQPGEYHDDNSSVISISPISNHYAKSLKGKRFDRRSLLEWKEIFAHAAFFRGYDASLFSHVFIMVFKNEGRLSTVSLTGRGSTIYEKLLLDERSRFWPSCENLETKFKGSKVRRALAITNLKNYTILASESRDLRSPWDETNAGSLASSMQLITEKSPLELGVKMLELGMLQSHYIESIVVDVIARQEWNKAEKQEEDCTSSVILGLGNQLDHLFDPLLEYSPEIVDFRYRVPIRLEEKVQNIPKIEEICQELIQVQANYTSRLSELLSDLVIPLRNHCTADSEKNILAVNKVFPPTIDEIVRINTILQESLKKAVSFGFLEILKVFSLLLPYFYRPFVRHEANIKGVSIRLHEFFDKNEELFEDSKLNAKQFTLRKIDSIVSGSLLELPQFKLILVRILEEVQKEEAESHELGVLSDAEEYLNSSIGVIDAFGYEKECTLENSTTRKRVFTATGKILEELATNWPFSLQYGWLTRKVVGIFELKNMLANSYDLEIMIIFSDAVVFLQVMNESYSNIRNRFDGLSLSDILMNSLVNEKPLPKLSNLPTLKVRHWFNVNDITISSYKGIDADANNEYSYLHILSSGSLNEDVKDGITLNYRILDDKQKSRGSRIIELVNKSKILNRRQPFHLLKTADTGLTMYSLIQDEQTYKEEKSKASVALFINHEKPSDLVEFFDLSKNIYLILNASFKSPSKVRLVGFNRDCSFQVDEVLNKDLLREAVKAITIRAYGHLNGKLAFQQDAAFNLYASYSKFLCSDFREYGTSSTLSENSTKENASEHNNFHISNEDGSPQLSTVPIKNDELKAIDSPRISPKSHAVGNLGHNSNKKSKNIIKRLFSMIRPKTRVKHRATHNGSVPTKQSQSQILKDATSGRKKPGLHKNNAIRAPLPGNKVSESSLVSVETKVDESIEFDQDKNLLTSKTNILPGKAPVNLSTKMKQSDNKDSDYRIPVETTEMENIISQQRNCVYPEKQRRQSLVSTIILVNDENSENTAISSRSSIFSPNSSRTLNCLSSNSFKDAFNCSFEYKVEDFYEDGQKNWIQVTRDNSSLLNAEIRALKEETNMDTEEVIFLNETNSASNTKAFNSLGSDNFHTALFSNTRDTNLHEKSTGAETSYQSETPSEIAREFSNFVSMNFESLDIIEQFDEKQGKQPKAKSPKVAAIGSPSTKSGTSDEEYFSTDDVDLSNSVFKSLYDVEVTV